MNEILNRKYLKQVMSYGVPKHIAKEIVEVAIEVSKGNNIEKYINYAIDLNYNLGLSQRANAK